MNRFSGRDEARVQLVEAYAKAQGMWFDPNEEKVFTDTLTLDLSTVHANLAGPKRPQDRIELTNAAASFASDLTSEKVFNVTDTAAESPVANNNYSLHHGDVVIAAITSCTNTSNAPVMIAAGLVARKARAKGLMTKPWVKTSLAPGSQVVTDYYDASGLTADLDALGFNLVGYGCTTCIGNSGPIDTDVSAAIKAKDLVACSVLSGNRNFEGRVHPQTQANYLMSPPLVVAYAIAGTMLKDIATESLGNGSDGQPVYLRDIWPSNQEIEDTLNAALTPAMFRARYADVFTGPEEWRTIDVKESETYDWQGNSTYVKLPPYFAKLKAAEAGDTTAVGALHDVKNARLLAVFGDNVTTDHISPAGDIKKGGPAGEYLMAHNVAPIDFNSFGARRGNHEIMMRGTFANIRIKNELNAEGGPKSITPETVGTVPEGGNTVHYPDGSKQSIYDAAMQYRAEGVPTMIIAGKEYGMGSSRDWAAKGPKLLGVQCVIAESFERIHRSNLVGMGIMPCEFLNGMTRFDLKLNGDETFTVSGISTAIQPRQELTVTMTRANGEVTTFQTRCRIDTLDEVDYMKADGILPFVLKRLAAA